MKHSLIWKEWRESRPALIAALLWLSASAIVFGLSSELGRLQPLVQLALLVQFTVGALGTYILLGAGRLLVEQQHGTWDFLRTVPAPLPRVLRAKWLTAVVLGASAAALFAATVRALLGADEARRIGLGVEWLFALPAGAVLLLAVLAVLDSIAWGSWIGARMALSAVSVIGLPMLILHSEAPPTVVEAAAWLACATVLFVSASTLVRWENLENFLPDIRNPLSARRGVSARFSASRDALRWLHLRRAAPAAIFVGLVWLLLIVKMRPGPAAGEAALRGVGLVILMSLPLFAAVLGGVGHWQDREHRLEGFLRTLPLAAGRRHAHQLLMGVAIWTLFAAALALPLLALRGWVEDVTWGLEFTVLLARSSVWGLLIVLLTHGLTSASPKVGAAIALFVALASLTWWLDLRSTSVLTEKLCVLAVISIALAAAAPWLEWRREV